MGSALARSIRGVSIAVLAAAAVCAGAGANASQKAFVVAHVTEWRTGPQARHIHGVPLRNFGELDPGCLYRSGQPTRAGFAWMKAQGFRSVVDVQRESDDGDENLRGYGFAYLHIALKNETGLSDEQARQFLEFVRDRSHWPILIHCRTGNGRSTMLAALVRYSVDGWSMSDALRECRNFRPFHFRMFGTERRWLNDWSHRFAPGSWHPSKPEPAWPVTNDARGASSGS